MQVWKHRNGGGDETGGKNMYIVHGRVFVHKRTEDDVIFLKVSPSEWFGRTIETLE